MFVCVSPLSATTRPLSKNTLAATMPFPAPSIHTHTNHPPHAPRSNLAATMPQGYHAQGWGETDKFSRKVRAKGVQDEAAARYDHARLPMLKMHKKSNVGALSGRVGPGQMGGMLCFLGGMLA